MCGKCKKVQGVRGGKRTGRTWIRIGNVGRAQGSDGAVAGAEIYKDAVVEAPDTMGAIM